MITKTSRRKFITKIAPTCALTCLTGTNIFGMVQTKPQQKPTHKFDLPMDLALTNRQYATATSRGKIELIKTMVKELGKEKAIEIIKTDTRESAFTLGQNQAKAAEKNDFYTYVDMFRDPEKFKHMLTMEIIEDSEKAFELKVTECLVAEPYLKTGLGGNVGFAALCYMDYFWPKGFNEKIKLVRDKTLIQGHKYCNHRYIWEG